jgi:hypothetical protein
LYHRTLRKCYTKQELWGSEDYLLIDCVEAYEVTTQGQVRNHVERLGGAILELREGQE